MLHYKFIDNVIVRQQKIAPKVEFSQLHFVRISFLLSYHFSLSKNHPALTNFIYTEPQKKRYIVHI